MLFGKHACKLLKYVVIHPAVGRYILRDTQGGKGSKSLEKKE